MKSAIILCLLIIVTSSASVCAQPPRFDPTRLKAPKQFYTNGIHVDRWNRDDARGQIVTLWFGKNPENSLSYRQLITILSDDDPDNIYYYDLVAKKYVGRYDMSREKYSLLERHHRLGRLEDIREEWFPEPGEKPSIGELFDLPDIGFPSDEILMMPPVSKRFPRLRNSTWEGFYTDIGGHRRRKMVLSFSGQRGRYRAPDVGISGNFTNVQYENRGTLLMIRGIWSAGNTEGGFEFRVMMKNLNEFQGEYWVGNDRRQTFLWDGKRTSR